jgi:hypothetical protein
MVVYAETDPTIVTNFLTMAETTVCKATLSSWSGSGALPVSTSREHREGRTSTALPNRSRGRSLEPPRPTGPPPPRVVYGEGHSRPAQPRGNFDLP